MHTGKRLQGVEVGGDVGERQFGGQVADAGAGLLKDAYMPSGVVMSSVGASSSAVPSRWNTFGASTT